MKENRKKILILTLLIIGILSIFTVVKLNNKKIETKVEENIIEKEPYAMYINNGDGYEEYTKSEEFPKGYELNIQNSKCTDANGDNVEGLENILSSSGNKVTVKSKNTIYCKLYFDKVDLSEKVNFYIKETTVEKYTKDIENIAYIVYDEEDAFDEYCITEANDSNSCVWTKFASNSKIETPYSFINETNGEKTVYAYLKTTSGNIIKKSDKIIFDNVKPKVDTLVIKGSEDSVSGYTKTVNTKGNLTYSDVTSGVESYCVSNTIETDSCTSWKKVTNENSINDVATTLASGDGSGKVIYAFVKDKAGNISDAKESNALALDTKAPVVSTFTITGSADSDEGYTRTTDVKGNLNYNDPQNTTYASGVLSYCISNISNDASKCENWVNVSNASSTNNISGAINEGDGSGKVLYAFVKDKAGNISTVKASNSLTLDRTNPSIEEFTIAGPTGSSSGYSISETAKGKLVYSDTEGSSGVSAYCISNSSDDVADCKTWIKVTNATTVSNIDVLLNGNGTNKFAYAFVKDKAGNISTVKTSNSLTVDTIPPTDLSLSANNDTAYTQTKEITVTLKDTGGSGLIAGSIQYGWSKNQSDEPSYETVSTAATTGTNTTTFKAKGSGLNGEYYLWVKPVTYKDKAGNSNTKIIKSSGTFKFDNAKPTITAFTITGSSGSSSGYSIGATPSSYTITSADAVAYCVMATNSANDCTWKTTVGEVPKISLGKADGTDDGTKTQYAFVKDAAGNISDGKSATIILDATKPTVTKFTITGSSGSSAGYSIGAMPSSYTIEGSDTNGIASYCVVSTNASSGCSWKATVAEVTKISLGKADGSDDGTKTQYAFVKDKAGNVSAVKNGTIILDATKPTITTFTITGSSGSSSGYSIGATPSAYAITGSDTNGIASYCVVGTNSASGCSWKATVAEVTKISLGKADGTDDGTKTQYAFVKDKAGNVSAVKNGTIILDATKPTVTKFSITGSSGSNSGYSIGAAPGSYSITGSDTNGIASYCVVSTNAASGCTWKATVAEVPKVSLGTPDGTKTQYAFVKDKAGNVSAVKNGTIILDTAKPTVSTFTITGSSGSNSGYSRSTSVTGKITYTDPQNTTYASGVEKYCVSNSSTDASKCTTWNNVTTENFSTTITSGDGSGKTVHAFVKDKAGNISAVKTSNALALDTVAPTVNVNNLSFKVPIDSNTSLPKLENLTWTLTGATDPAQNSYSSGLDKYSYGCGGNSSYKTTANNSATCENIDVNLWQSNYSIYIKVSDKAGNVSSVINKSSTIGGSGTSSDPILITKIEHLVILSNKVNAGTNYTGKYLNLLTNLDFKSTNSYINSTRTDFGDINGNTGDGNNLLNELTTGTGFKPIGYMDGNNSSTSKPFRGTFDGKSNKISNLRIFIASGDENSSIRYGFFGYVNNGTIKNLTLDGTNATVGGSSGGYYGGIAGQISNSSVIDNCHNKISIANNFARLGTGGIAGIALSSTIKNSTNSGSIMGGQFLGGIVGDTGSTAVTITASKNSGSINYSTGASDPITYAGGLIGRATTTDNSLIKISNSSSSGSITSTFRAGGLVGFLNDTSLIIDRSFNTGAVKVNYSSSSKNTENRQVGGLLGSAGLSEEKQSQKSFLAVINSYNTGEVRITTNMLTGSLNDLAYHAAGLVGLTQESTNPDNFTTYVINSYNRGNVYARDFAQGIIHAAGKTIIRNVYSSGVMNSESGVNKNLGVGLLKTPITNGSSSTNAYFLKDETKNNTYAISDGSTPKTGYGLGRTLNDLQTSTTILNSLNGSTSIDLKTYDSNLSGYGLCGWTGTDGTTKVLPSLNFSHDSCKNNP